MSPRPPRNPELTRLYVAAGLGALVWVIFRVYKLLSPQVATGLDAPSRWALLAVGLLNVLAIAAVGFIVARSLAKLWFERRRGILGARIRSRLVLAIFGVGILPSLLLFLVGRNFISKNIDRWFQPGTRQVIQDGKEIAEAYRVQAQARLTRGLGRLPAATSDALDPLRQEAGLDLLARLDPGAPPPVTAEGLAVPGRLEGGMVADSDGLWLLEVTPLSRPGPRYLGGILIPRHLQEGLTRLELRHQEATDLHTLRETLETLPQSTFLLLTLVTLFVAVWVGLTLARTIAEPVRALARAAQRVGQGDLQVHLPEQGEDELALLSQTFNAMTRDLAANRAAIEAQAARIERQRAYQSQLLEALPVGVMSWSPNGELRTCNPSARQWLGLEDWEAEAHAWGDLATQPRMGRLPALLEAVRETHRPQVEEVRVGGEGDGRPVRILVVPLAGGGELAVLEDLSLLAQAEKRAAWQEVARRMAHEVKNPLTPIKLTAQRLLRRTREGRLDPASVAEGAETILTEVSSLARLVDSFSRFAKLPAPQPARLDACDLLRQVHALYAPAHPGVRFDLKMEACPLEAWWDGDMVKRALINFVDNALAAQGTRGTLRLALALQDGHAVLSVEDEAGGVPEAHRGNLFQPYFSTKTKGTGLGLAISRRIAEDHGGEARYAPTPTGSCFSLVMPLFTPSAR